MSALRALWRPPLPGEVRGRLRWFGVVACLAFALLLARRPDFVQRPQFWAEDGAVFYRDQLTLGLGRALFEPHAGYPHVVPRLLAAALSPLPTLHQPLGYLLAASALAALCCAWVVRDEHRRWLPSRRARAALALWLACSPASGEVVGNVVNLQWYLLWLGLLLVVGPLPARPAGQVAWSGALALVAASAPGAIALVPLLGARAALATGRARALALAPALVAIAQAAVGWSGRGAGPRPFSVATGLDLEPVTTLGDAALGATRLVCRTLSGPLLGEHDRLGVVRRAHDVAPIACALVVSVILLAAWRRARPGPRAFLALGGTFLLVYLGALCAGRGSLLAAAARSGPNFGMGRYFWPTSALVGAALLVALSHVRRPTRRLAAVWLGLLVAPAAMSCFRVNASSDGSWPRGAAAIDDALRERASCQLAVPLQPRPWTLRLRMAAGLPLRDGPAWPDRAAFRERRR